jgi:hypothetical protein
MNVGELRTLFQATLNNDECTDALADTFIAQGVRRTERKLRTPMQKFLYEYTVPADFTYLTLPYDYLTLDWLKVNGEPVYRFAPQLGGTLEGLTETTYGSRRFWVENEKMYFSPTLVEDDAVKLNYYQTFDQGDEDGDTTHITSVIPDLILYQALVPAAIYFLDDRLATFQNEADTILSEVALQADLDELSGGAVISNPYEGII